MSSHIILSASHLKKFYEDGQQKVEVLKQVNFSIQQGDQVAIVGPSGSGKSTLLHLLGTLEKPSSGEISIMGENVWSCSEKQRCRLRNRALGFIYQFHHLLPEFTALENIMMPLLLANTPKKQAQAKAVELLNQVKLSSRASHKPSKLSGGERQRVAIARALAMDPYCILADEPTGNLDQKNAESIYELLLELNKSMKTSLVIVTHDLQLASQMTKRFRLSEGCLLEEKM